MDLYSPRPNFTSLFRKSKPDVETLCIKAQTSDDSRDESPKGDGHSGRPSAGAKMKLVSLFFFSPPFI